MYVDLDGLNQPYRSGHATVRIEIEARILDEAKRNWDRHPELREAYSSFEAYLRYLQGHTYG